MWPRQIEIWPIVVDLNTISLKQKTKNQPPPPPPTHQCHILCPPTQKQFIPPMHHPKVVYYALPDSYPKPILRPPPPNFGFYALRKKCLLFPEFFIVFCIGIRFVLEDIQKCTSTREFEMSFRIFGSFSGWLSDWSDPKFWRFDVKLRRFHKILGIKNFEISKSYVVNP